MLAHSLSSVLANDLIYALANILATLLFTTWPNLTVGSATYWYKFAYWLNKLPYMDIFCKFTHSLTHSLTHTQKFLLKKERVANQMHSVKTGGPTQLHTAHLKSHC
jgi:hypothetical protein